jgi:hypothetical protein
LGWSGRGGYDDNGDLGVLSEVQDEDGVAACGRERWWGELGRSVRGVQRPGEHPFAGVVVFDADWGAGPDGADALKVIAYVFCAVVSYIIMWDLIFFTWVWLVR